MSRLCIFLLLVLVTCSCNRKLILPLKGGVVFTNGTSVKEYYVHGPGNIHITPKNSLEVRAVENCQVERVCWIRLCDHSAGQGDAYDWVW